ncbi:DEKNAAC105022 [Brettanomyces naardenensis]|uniref:DEKNAAC105022 n=1 Tax=Brettanomyces naardenensis TaxID=13370 RepID=A0A448YRV1_BRENA|nr:DEKNAAC105022 [Brettanomyces naardenensis]
MSYPEMDELELEEFGFQSRRSIQLFHVENSFKESIKDEYLNNLAISYTRQKIIAALRSEIKTYDISNLSGLLEPEDEDEGDLKDPADLTSSNTIHFDFEIQQIRLNQDESKMVIVFDESQRLAAIPLADLLDSKLIEFPNEKMTLLGKYSSKIVDVSLSKQASNLVICLLESGELWLVDLEKEGGGKLLSQEVTGAAWNHDSSNEILIGTTSDRNVYVLNAEGGEITSTIKFEDDVLGDNFRCLFFTDISESSTLVIYGTTRESDDHEADYRSFIIRDGLFSNEAVDICMPWGAIARKASFYAVHLNNWCKDFPNLLFTIGSKSTDFNTLIPESQITELNDSDRAQMPIDEESGDDDTVLGFTIDLQASKQVLQPCKILDVSGPLPRFIVLTNRGQLLTWNIWYTKAVKAKEDSLSEALSYALRGSDGQKAKPVHEHAEVMKPSPPMTDSIFSTATVKNPFGGSTDLSSFTPVAAQPESLAPKPAKDAKPFAFGQSGFSAPEFGQSNFGRHGFGTSSAFQQASQPQMGSGAPKVGTTNSSGFSAFASTGSAFASAAGSSTSPFAQMMSKDSNSSPFGGLASQTSPFAKFGTESKGSPTFSFTQNRQFAPPISTASSTEGSGAFNLGGFSSTLQVENNDMGDEFDSGSEIDDASDRVEELGQDEDEYDDELSEDDESEEEESEREVPGFVPLGNGAIKESQGPMANAKFAERPAEVEREATRDANVEKGDSQIENDERKAEGNENDEDNEVDIRTGENRNTVVEDEVRAPMKETVQKEEDDNSMQGRHGDEPIDEVVVVSEKSSNEHTGSEPPIDEPLATTISNNMIPGQGHATQAFDHPTHANDLSSSKYADGSEKDEVSMETGTRPAEKSASSEESFEKIEKEEAQVGKNNNAEAEGVRKEGGAMTKKEIGEEEGVHIRGGAQTDAEPSNVRKSSAVKLSALQQASASTQSLQQLQKVEVVPSYVDERVEAGEQDYKYFKEETFEDDEVYLSELDVPPSVPLLISAGNIEYPSGSDSAIKNQMLEIIYDTETDLEFLRRNIDQMNIFLSKHMDDQIMHTLSKSLDFYSFWRLDEGPTIAKGISSMSGDYDTISTDLKDMGNRVTRLSQKIASCFKLLPQFEEALTSRGKPLASKENESMPFDSIQRWNELSRLVKQVKEEDSELESKLLILNSLVHPDELVNAPNKVDIVLSDVDSRIRRYFDDLTELKKEIRKAKSSNIEDTQVSRLSNDQDVSRDKVRLSSIISGIAARKTLTELLNTKKASPQRYSL